MAAVGSVRVVVLALHLSCAVCGGEARVDAVVRTDLAEALARFAAVHVAPTIAQVEVLLNGAHRVAPVIVTR